MNSLQGLLEKVAAHLPDDYSRDKLKQVSYAVALIPMRLVLDKVKGDTTVEKAKLVGVSRNTWYAWHRGEIRPNKHQAARLSELSGVAAEKFQGRR